MTMSYKRNFNLRLCVRLNIYFVLKLLISGTFCEKDSDCNDACCVLEPTINSHLPICKPTLGEYHQCAAILYRKIWVGDKPDCGPCKPGLECVQKGSVIQNSKNPQVKTWRVFKNLLG